jgi:acetyl-CoA carboxylase, biotin carboxylase subunit
MFKKLLIANRGEIAVRILRTCRDLGITTLALYEPVDRGSLHVRLADESACLESRRGFLDGEAVLAIARQRGVDAIHPGYGFLAEREDFIRACQEAGVAFIGPPASVVGALRHKVDALRRAESAGFPVASHSCILFTGFDPADLRMEAESLGYPLVIKSCRGGRGRGERLVWDAARLEKAVRAAQSEAQTVYGDPCVFLEKAILPAHQIGVQVAADRFGNLIHLGDREGSLRFGNQKLIEETPSPFLTGVQRQAICEAALDLARLFQVENVVTVEFLVDGDGQFYFTEIKPRIQIEHPLSEIVARLDLVRLQIRLAAGEPLGLQQSDIHLDGWAIQCRLSAEDPWQGYMPSPGALNKVRLPTGPDVRVDTYVYGGCDIPARYDPLLAKVIVWGPDRPTCLARLRQALRECQFSGVPTNLPLLQRIIDQSYFIEGSYTTEFLFSSLDEQPALDAVRARDLAAIAAIAYLRNRQVSHPVTPERLQTGWHRDSRRLS